MSRYDDITDRFAEEAFKDDPNFLAYEPRARSANVFVGTHNGVYAIFSYGYHFPMALAVTNGGEQFWLVNGDTYSVTTNRHQASVRSALQRRGGGRAALIVPFSALQAARVNLSTVLPCEVEEERFTKHKHHVATFADLPKRIAEQSWAHRQLDDGSYVYETHEHFLGAAVLKAEYLGVERRFLSAFDHQEPLRNRPYFLCQLPDHSEATTVAEALEDLKPPEVLKAEACDVPVRRQGDIFAVETELSTRFLKSQPGAVYGKATAKCPSLEVTGQGKPHYPDYGKPIVQHFPDDERAKGVLKFLALWNLWCPGKRFTTAQSTMPDTLVRERARLLGTSHVGTEVITIPEVGTFARGTLRHDPGGWRQADHVRQTLGKKWHQVVRNTVPQENGQNRAWQVSGRAD